AGRMEYDIIHLTPIEGVQGRSDVVNGLWEIEVDLPLELIGLSYGSRRHIGFNVVRLRKDNRSWSKWSGLPGELSVHFLQGLGDLILAHDLTAAETETLIEHVVADSNTYYTKWERQKLPADILNDVRAKKSGFSLRLKKEDVERL